MFRLLLTLFLFIAAAFAFMTSPETGVLGVGLTTLLVLAALVAPRTLRRASLSRAARQLGLQHIPHGIHGERTGATVHVDTKSPRSQPSQISYLVQRHDLEWLPVRLAPRSRASRLAALVGREDVNDIGLPAVDRDVDVKAPRLIARLLLEGDVGERVAELVDDYDLHWSRGRATTGASGLDLRSAKVVRTCEACLELAHLLAERAERLPRKLFETALNAPTWRAADEALQHLRDSVPDGVGSVRDWAYRELDANAERRRVIAACALANRRGDRDWVLRSDVGPTVRELAAEAAEPEVRAFALALAVHDAEAVSLLRAALSDAADLVSATAAWALSRRGYTNLEDLEVDSPRHGRPPSLANTIGPLLGDDDRAEPALIALLDHPDEAVVEDALAALSGIGGPRTLKALSRLGDTSPRLSGRLDLTRSALRGRLGDGFGGGLTVAGTDGGALAVAGVEDGALSLSAEESEPAELLHAPALKNTTHST